MPETKKRRFQDLITADQKKADAEALRKKRLGRVAPPPMPKKQYAHTDVNTIVSRMKKRYEERGITAPPQTGKAAELKKMVAGDRSLMLDQRSPAELSTHHKPFVRFVGRVFSRLGFLNILVNRIASYGFVRSLPAKLDSANMIFSVKQYVGVCIVAAMLGAAFFSLPLVALITILFGQDISLWVAVQLSPAGALGALGLQGLAQFAGIGAQLGLAVGGSAALWVIGLFVALTWPSSATTRRGRAIDRNLPFALRHMATEVRAGVGIHKTMSSLVSADYGELSVEFERTLNDIEKGMSTEDALDAMSKRSPSESLGRALLHMIRALKTGGNLSDIIETIARDVSFELRMKMRDFVERLNLIGLFYMMVGIVFPVFIAVLAGIFNAIPTLGMAGMLGTESLFLIYFILIPMTLSLILYIIKVMQPM